MKAATCTRLALSYGWQICSLKRHFAISYEKRGQLVEMVVKKGLRPSLKSRNYPARIKNLTRDCWAENPQRRPTFTTIRLVIEDAIANCSQQATVQ